MRRWVADASSKVPYLQAYGNIKKALDKITKATVPPKFTQDFLATTLDMPGGGARPVIEFLKRAGFLTSEGTPTDLYKQFRNPSFRGAAAAPGIRNAYSDLYVANEYVHNASDKDLKGLIIQVTGLEEDSKLIPAMVASFKTLKEYADFHADVGANLNQVIDEGKEGTRLATKASDWSSQRTAVSAWATRSTSICPRRPTSGRVPTMLEKS